MAAALDLLPLYLHVARASELRRQPLVCDKLLVLAGAAATEAGMPAIAALCRQRVLANNPGHLLRHYATFDAALADERFVKFHAQLALAHPREKLEHILAQLGVAWEGERDLYYTDEEYAAALLGRRPEDARVPPDRSPSPAPIASADQRQTALRRTVAIAALVIAGVGLALACWIFQR